MSLLDEDGHRTKRFKYQSYNARLAEVHLPSVLSKSTFDYDGSDDDQSSQLYQLLTHLLELNLGHSFVTFAQKALLLAQSLPLLILNWSKVVDLWKEAVNNSDGESLKALFDVMQIMIEELRSTLLPAYNEVIDCCYQYLSRSISPESLTALLTVLSGLFKHLLVPSTLSSEDVNAVNIALLESTWTKTSKAICKCKDQVQHALAEVWAQLLRRLRQPARSDFVKLVFQDDSKAQPESAQNFLAFVFVFTMKSVAHSLHTCTESVLSRLVDTYISATATTSEVLDRILRRVLTALVHHCSYAEQFTPVSEFLTGRLVHVVDQREQADCDIRALSKTLELVSIICTVRKGSRLLPAQLSKILTTLLKVKVVSELELPLTTVTVACLTSSMSDTAIAMGPGRRIIEQAWNSSTLYALRLSGILIDLEWSGFKSFGLPWILKIDPSKVEGEECQLLLLRIFSQLVKANMLDKVQPLQVWKETLISCLQNLLSAFTLSNISCLYLLEILPLLSFLQSPSLGCYLHNIIDNTLSSSIDSKENYQDKWGNEAWVLGACLSEFSKLDNHHHTEHLDTSSWAKVCLQRWAWSESVMRGLADWALSSRNEAKTRTPLDQIFPSVVQCLMSHSHTIRFSILSLLKSSVIDCTNSGAVIESCVAVEMIPINVQGARERAVRTLKLVKTSEDFDEISAELCMRWLLGQLKVNLQPLWKPSAEAIGILSSKFPDIVWCIAFKELKTVCEQNQNSQQPPHWYDESAPDLNIREEEKSWRDPNSAKVRDVLVRWNAYDSRRRQIIEEQKPQGRFDVSNYEVQLLAALETCSALAERHSRELVPLFLSFASAGSNFQVPRQKLIIWLNLFSKFVNPKALFNSSLLHELYMSLIAHPDRSLQSLSLTCLLNYKVHSLLSYEEKLRALLDDARWREEITLLELDKIESNDRAELIPIVIRLLYGTMLEKKGQNRSHGRRSAALSALGGCRPTELSLLVSLMLSPFFSRQQDISSDMEWMLSNFDASVSERQHIGFLNLLGDVLKVLGTQIMEDWPKLIAATLSLTAHAQSNIDVTSAINQPMDDEENSDVDEVMQEKDSLKACRVIRQLGIKRFTDFFRFQADFNFEIYMSYAFKSCISPRIPNFDTENTQAPSALLELFYVWSQNRRTVAFLVQYDVGILEAIYGCLASKSVKAQVIHRIFDITDRILTEGSEDNSIVETIVKPYMPMLLSNLVMHLQHSLRTDDEKYSIGYRLISLLSQVAPYINSGKDAGLLLELLSPLLSKSNKLISEKLKGGILSILPNIFPLIPEIADLTSSLHQKTFILLSKLFFTLKERQSRLSLVAAFQQFVHLDKELDRLSDIIELLNSYSKKRVEEPDFDRRLAAYARINEDLYQTLTFKEWSIILNNMLFFIQDEGELSIRSNASLAMKRFLGVFSNNTGDLFLTCFNQILYPGLKRGLRCRSEMVRAEILSVLAYGIANCDRIESFKEMRILLAGTDEEANFFNNILHIQIHRRLRALHRLADYCDKTPFRSSILHDIFIPLVASFIQPTSVMDHHLVNESILTMGRLVQHLSWGAYYSLLQNYLRKLSNKNNGVERAYVRAVVAILEGFHFSMETTVEANTNAATVGAEDDEGSDEEVEEPTKFATDSVTTARIADVVNRRLLPTLLKFLQSRDEVDDLNRIPVAVGIATVASNLPQDSRELQISQLFTVLSQVFRSKSQDTRDLTRDTLCRIVGNLGIQYLPIAIKELRSALIRGPHLHVLAFVAHSLLVYLSTNESIRIENLDICVADIAHVSAEVIFGRSGEDVQSEGFKTKMREVHGSSSRGLDSFAILSRFITPSAISTLLFPIKSIMQETQALKVMQKTDEILKRIAGGINANTHLGPADLLVLCHTLISQNARFLQESVKIKKKRAKGVVDVTVRLKRKVEVDDHYAHNSYRFISFGLDLFNTAYRRGRFDFQESKIIARLEPMVNTIGNTLYSTNDQVVALGLKASANIVKCPLKSIDKSLPVFIKQILEILKQHSNTDSEIMQTACKSLATILRDCAPAKVKEKDLAYLLELISPDLEEPNRQGTAFSLLRAIIARKFVVADIYDIMDRVSEIMVTSQSTQVQELCRSSLLQFLLDYPQGQGRLKNQMSFLVKNLSYVYESGRLSVMELLSAVILKFNDDLLNEYADLLFVGLVMGLANDESAKCRERAATLIKSLLVRIGDQQKTNLLSHVHTWVTQKDKHALQRVGCQVYGLALDTLQENDATAYLEMMLDDVQEVIKESASALDDQDEESSSEEGVGWQTIYQALTALSKILVKHPSLVNHPLTAIIPSAKSYVQWAPVTSHLLHPHSWVRTVSCRLLGTLFSTCPIALPETEDDIEGNTGDIKGLLSLEGMRILSKALCEQLKSRNLDEQLGLQIVKNLFFVGKCFCVEPVSQTQSITIDHEDNGDDEHESDDEEESNDEEDNDDEKGNRNDEKGSILPWLFSRLSYQARSVYIQRRNKQSNPENWSQPILAVLRWFAAMTSYMDGEKLERYLPHILSPVYRLIEDDTVKDAQMSELKTTAIELQDLVQKRVGVTKFSAVYNVIRQKVVDTRHERKAARTLLTTTNPRLAAQRKIKRNISKKDNRKRKNGLFTEGKVRKRQRMEDY